MVVTWGTKWSHGAKVIAFSFGVWYPVNRMCIPTGGDEPMNQRIWDVIFGSVHDQMGSAEAHYLNVSMFVQWISAIAVILLVLTYHAELRWKRRLLFLPLSAAVFAEYLTYQYYMYQAELFRYKIPIFASLYLALLLTVALLCKGKLHEIITRISAALIIAHLSQELKITCSILSSWITALQCYQHIPRMVRIILWELLPVAAVLLLLYFARPPARLPVRCWNLMLLFCGAFLLSRWIELLPVPHGDPHFTVQWRGWQDVLHSLSFLFENLAMLFLCLIGCCIRVYTEKMDTMYSTISQQKQELDRVRQEYQAFSMLRHDYKNQLICVQTLLQQNEPDKAAAYLETLTKKHFSDTSEIQSSSTIINAVLHAKYSEAAEAGIPLSCRITSPLPEPLEYDSSLILFNLLDNAIEACRKQDGSPEIVVSLSQCKGYYRILVKNTIPASVLSGNAALATTKPDTGKHGFGLHNVRLLAEAHEGTLDIYENEHWFIVSVLLMVTDSK